MTAGEMVVWPTTHGDVVEVYEGTDGEFWYRVQAANGEVVDRGSEGYIRRDDAVAAAERHHPVLSDTERPSFRVRVVGDGAGPHRTVFIYAGRPGHDRALLGDIVASPEEAQALLDLFGEAAR